MTFINLSFFVLNCKKKKKIQRKYMQINPTVLLHWDTCDWLRFSAYCLDIKIF